MSRQAKESEYAYYDRVQGFLLYPATEPQEETRLTLRQRDAVETTGKDAITAFKGASTNKRKQRTQLEWWTADLAEIFDLFE
jgi:hypothetical protein